MKKYTNIPLKERIRNAERCYRHEASREEREIKRLCKEKERQCESQYETDKERQFSDVENELLKAIAKGGTA